MPLARAIKEPGDKDIQRYQQDDGCKNARDEENEFRLPIQQRADVSPEQIVGVQDQRRPRIGVEDHAVKPGALHALSNFRDVGISVFGQKDDATEMIRWRSDQVTPSVRRH